MRIGLAVALGIGLALGAQSLRADTWEGRPLVDLWSLKRSWQGAADVVLMGDSRVTYALAPAVLEEGGLGRRVHNFAFFGLGWTGAYLDAGRSVLDDDAPHRRIVLGITMRSFSDLAVARSSFDDPHEGGDVAEWPEHLEGLDRAIGHLTEPIPLRLLLDGIVRPGSASRSVRRVHDDGWIAADQHPRAPLAAVHQYTSRIGQWTFSTAALEAMLERIRAWQAEGIEVLVVSVPTSPAMREVEGGLRGYDRAALAEALRRAGARLFDLGDVYGTYDGGHLHEAAARRFSADLARAIGPPPR